jgi:hypothetical protein
MCSDVSLKTKFTRYEEIKIHSYFGRGGGDRMEFLYQGE